MKKITFLLIIIPLLMCACTTTPKPPYVFEPSLKSPSIPIGEVEIQFNKIFPLPGIKKMNVNVFYFPIEDAVCLQWRMDFWTYYQFWSPEGREEFIKLLEQYKSDYENRSFGRSSRSSKRVYGNSFGYIAWQMFEFTEQAKKQSIIDFGYYFVDRSPYFVVNQREVYYESPYSRDNNMTLKEMSMYFTRAQADELASLFNPEYLAAINLPNASVRDVASDFDDY